jgi:hypothetical protein
MVIDAKLPPEDSAPLPAPPPAYAPASEVSQSSPNPPHQHQQYPPSSGQNYSGSPTLLPPQWNAPATGSQPMPPDEWVGQQYRNQRKSFPGRSRFLIILYFQFSLNVRGVTMIRPPASAFVGSFALFFYSQLASSFFGTPCFVSSLACKAT